MASPLSWRDLPNFIQDTPEDKAFYDKLYNQSYASGEKPAPLNTITQNDVVNLAQQDPDAILGDPDTLDADVVPKGFKLVQHEPDLPKGFQAVSDTLPKGFKAVDHELPKGFQAIDHESGPFEKTYKQNVNTVKDILNIPGQIASMGASLLIPGMREGAGDNPQEAAKETEKVVDEYSHKVAGHDLPNSEPSFISQAGSAIGAGISHGVDMGLNLFSPGNFMRALTGDEDVDLTKNTSGPDVENPNPSNIMKTALTLGLMGKGAKEVAKGPATIDGTATRIPENTLPAPPGAKGVADSLKEQQQSEAAANQKVLDNYNQDPTKYGVDESGKINPYLQGDKTIEPPAEPMPAGMRQDVVDSKSFNPYFRGGALLDDPAMTHDPSTGYMVLNDAFHLEDKVSNVLDSSGAKEFEALDPAEARKPPTSQELQNMRQLGDQVIQKIQAEGLSTGQVHRQFWDTTYKELPVEVQQRFDMLKEKAESRTGLTGLSDNPADVTGMARWYVALMHLANNYAWGPKSAGAIENRIDIKKLDDPEVGRDHNAPTLIQSDQPGAEGDYIKTVVQQGKRPEGGSLNTVLSFISRVSSDPFERILARKLQHPQDPTLKIVEGPNKAFGNALVGHTGEKSVNLFVDPEKFDMRGLSTVTVLHEGLHTRIVPILELGRDSRTRDKYPIYARFADEVGQFALTLQRELPDNIKDLFGAVFRRGALENMGSPGHELISWALTNKAFADMLSRIHVAKDGKSLFTKLIENVGDVVWDGMYSPEEQARLNKKLEEQTQLALAFGDTALNELINLVMPILEVSKNDVHDPRDLRLVLNAYDGWMRSADLYSPIKEPENMMDLLTDSSDLDSAQMIKKDLPNPDVIHKMVSPNTSIADIVRTYNYSDYTKYPDTNVISANWYPTTVAKNIIGNPLFTFGVMRVRQINGATHVIQKFLYESIELFNKAPEAQKNRIVTALNQINRPENQDVLASARVQKSKAGPAWWRDPNNLRISPEEAVHFGMKLEDYQVYKTTLQPLFETLLKIDKAMLQKGFNRTYDSTVIGYFPRSFGFGSFVVKGFVITPNGEKELKAYRRLPNFIEQRQWMKAWQDQGLEIEKEQAKDFSNFVDHLLAMIELDPNSNIAKRAEDLMQKMEEHKRSQEFERSSRGVVGYIGTQMKDPNELKMLNYMVYHRIKMTSDLYKAARLMNEIARPIRANPILSRMWPNAAANIMDIIRRDLGGDISKLKAIDNSLVQTGLSTVYKAYLYTKPGTRKLLTTVDPTIPKSRRRGVKQPKDYVKEQILTPDAHRIFAKQAAAFGSSYALIGNIPNMLTNFGSIPFVALLGGAVDAFILADNMEQKMKGVFFALKAHALAISDLLEYRWNRVSDPQVKKFMGEVERRGYLVPAQYDDVKQLRDDITKSKSVQVAAKVLSTPKHVFNDPIEAATNIMTFLYYNRLIRLLHPNISANSHMNLVLEFSKNYTGDYAPYNRALMFDKAGDFGRLANNFTIWAGTRQGQIHFLTKNLGSGATEALITLFASQIVIAGIEGMPFTSDYENFRQAIHNLSGGKYNLPPLDALLKKVKQIPYEMRKGMIMNHFGYDMASRAKWSGWFDMSGVTYSLLPKGYHIGKFVYKEIYESIAGKGGPDLEQKANFVNALPTMLHGPAQQYLMSKNLRKDGKTTIVNRFGKSMYVQNGTGR
jgi:hypothetical protein